MGKYKVNHIMAGESRFSIKKPSTQKEQKAAPEFKALIEYAWDPKGIIPFGVEQAPHFGKIEK